MATTANIEVKDNNPVAALQEFLRKILDDDEIGGVLVPLHLKALGGLPMATLVTDPEALERADPLAPSFPVNSARTVARLSRGATGEKLAVVLRPCEIRAFVELVKLNQGSAESLVLIGMDCLGAYDNKGYRDFLGSDDPIASTLGFVGKKGGEKDTAFGDQDITPACLACGQFTPQGADIEIGVVGANLHQSLPVKASTPRGVALLGRLGLPEGGPSSDRDQALDSMRLDREANRERMFQETSKAVASLESLAEYLSGCVNCYNCRVACPVCYCKECVFVTDVFDHKPWQYMGWARRKGSLKMPTDTVFYHLTRMAHMSTSCVGCGQCSNACPNGIGVAELFQMVAASTQDAFEYAPGRSLDEAPPLSVFREKEFSEVTGLKE
jgi:formate dehydrogenase subunit beta